MRLVPCSENNATVIFGKNWLARIVAGLSKALSLSLHGSRNTKQQSSLSNALDVTFTLHADGVAVSECTRRQLASRSRCPHRDPYGYGCEA